MCFVFLVVCFAGTWILSVAFGDYVLLGISLVSLLGYLGFSIVSLLAFVFVVLYLSTLVWCCFEVVCELTYFVGVVVCC